MEHTLHQEQELRQLQRLTPMQVQYVRMLEMTGPEVESEVARALDEMAALEIADAAGVDVDSTDGGDEFNETPEEVQYADYAGDDDTPSYMLEARNRSADDERYEPMAVNDEQSLAESLESQLAEMQLSPRLQLAARYVIGNLDGNGYLQRQPNAMIDDVAITEGVELSEREMLEALDCVRQLDPAGVGAVDLRDCLLLQIKRRENSVETVTAREILTHYFDLFSKKHYNRIMELLGIDNDALKRAIDMIAHLNPKPGNQQGDSALERSGRIIVPELAVEVDGGEITVQLLNNVPELAVSASFAADTPVTAALTPRQRAETNTFIRSRREEAATFIKTLTMRQQTLFRVMSAIASLQRDYFLSGDVGQLRPMILKDVAQLTGYDLSVISRATASKYVVTPWGTLPLKFFFKERPKADEDATFHQIADAIQSIIEAEDKNSPLPDESITEILSERGFNIARRTVAKYRERLGYPVARLRRTI